MVQVRLEVHTGPARFRVSVRAQSARRAVRLAGARYRGGEVKVLRPAGPILAGVSVATTGGSGPFRKAMA